MEPRFDKTMKEITPVSMEIPSGKAKTSPEKTEPSIERKINPEDERLPGSATWSGMLVDSAAKRKDAIKLWGTTMGARMNSTAESVGASHARTMENAFTSRANQFSQREAKHAAALARLEVSTGVMNLPGLRTIKGIQVGYHAWRERVNQRKASRADARAEKFSKRAETAEKYQKYFDGKISAKVEKVSGKWQSKLDTVRAPRERIDERIQELAEQIENHETLIAKVKTRVSELENSTGGDRKARRDSLRELYKALASEEANLASEMKLFERANKHRVRLAGGEDSCQAVINGFEARYDDHEAWEAPKGPEAPAETAPGTDTASADAAPITPEVVSESLRDLAESKGEITNAQIEKLWNRMFTGSKLPDGFKTLNSLIKASFPDWELSDDPKFPHDIKSFLNRMDQLFDKSPAFQKLVHEATGKKGTRGKEDLMSRIHTRLAISDLSDL